MTSQCGEVLVEQAPVWPDALFDEKGNGGDREGRRPVVVTRHPLLPADNLLNRVPLNR